MFRITPRILYKLFQHIRTLPLLIRLSFRVFKDRRVPFKTKLIPLLALLYLISPIDLLGDIFVPLIGYGDDVVVIIFALNLFIRLSPRDVVAEHLAIMKAEETGF